MFKWYQIKNFADKINTWLSHLSFLCNLLLLFEYSWISCTRFGSIFHGKLLTRGWSSIWGLLACSWDLSPFGLPFGLASSITPTSLDSICVFPSITAATFSITTQMFFIFSLYKAFASSKTITSIRIISFASLSFPLVIRMTAVRSTALTATSFLLVFHDLFMRFWHLLIAQKILQRELLLVK